MTMLLDHHPAATAADTVRQAQLRAARLAPFCVELAAIAIERGELAADRDIALRMPGDTTGWLREIGQARRRLTLREHRVARQLARTAPPVWWLAVAAAHQVARRTRRDNPTTSEETRTGGTR